MVRLHQADLVFSFYFLALVQEILLIIFRGLTLVWPVVATSRDSFVRKVSRTIYRVVTYCCNLSRWIEYQTYWSNGRPLQWCSSRYLHELED